MNDNVDKNIEKFIEKTMRYSVLESPSFDFTNNVMSQVNSISNTGSVVHKPLIPKIVWTALFIGILVITLYAFFGTESANTGWFSKLDFSFIERTKIVNPLSGHKISKTFAYAMLLFALMVCVQIPLLKNHFNKQFQN